MFQLSFFQCQHFYWFRTLFSVLFSLLFFHFTFVAQKCWKNQNHDQMTNCISSTRGRHLHLASSFWHAKMFILVFILCTICLVRKRNQQQRKSTSWRMLYGSEKQFLGICQKVDNLHQFSLNLKSIFTNVLPSKTHYFQSLQLFSR